MLASTVLLLACFWLLGRVLRGALVGVQARWVAAGRPLAPFALTLWPVPAFAGEELWYAAGASRWRAPPATGGGWTLRLGRCRRLTVQPTGPARGARYAVAGHARETGGVLVVTSGRVAFRGRGRAAAGAREDVPLGDVAHLRVDGPLLVVERRSRPARPLVVRVGAPVPVAGLIAAASAAAGRVPGAAPRPGGVPNHTPRP